jgi:hypothetical protein
VFHLFRDETLAGKVHLRKIAVDVRGLAARDPFRARRGNAVSIVVVTVTTIAWRAVRGGH